MTKQLVSFEVENGIGTLTLNRPPVNVINIAMLQQMESALAELAQDATLRVLVVQAAGKLFSAGVDVADHTVDKVGEMIPLFNRVCVALANFPTPTITAVHGHALGGGCEIVICSDMTVMSEKAKIGQPEIQLAVFAPIAAMRLPWLVGYQAAADLMFTGRNLTAQEAHSIGLVNAIVPVEQVNKWAQEKATHLASLSRAALTLAKQALQIGYGNWANAMPEMERLYLDKLMQTADTQEGLASFMEKRRPIWKHE